MKATILFDFNEESKHSIALAKKLSTKLDMQLEPVYIVKAPDDSMQDAERNSVISVHCNDEVAPQLEQIQADVKTFLHDDELFSNTRLLVGSEVNQILNHLNTSYSNVVFMGTTELRGIKAAFEGSLAERLVRLSPVPMLTLKCNREDMEFSKVLVAGHFTVNEQHDFSFLKQLHDALSTEINFLTIRTNQKEPEEEIKARQQYFANKYGITKYALHSPYYKDVLTGILDQSEQLGIDLIALGAKGKTAFKHLLSDKTTQKIVNTFYKPILTYKVAEL